MPKIFFVHFVIIIHCVLTEGSSPGVHKITTPSHEFFTATSDMEILHKVDKKLAKLFLNYVKKEQQRLDNLERHIKEIEAYLPTKSLKPDVDENWVSRLTNSYKIMKRFVAFWPNITNFSKKKTTELKMKKLKSDLERLKRAYPTEEDLRGSLSALIRLQDTYAISPENFIEGLAPYSHKLKLEEIFEIGFLCVGINDYYHAQKWFKEALYRFPPMTQKVGFLDKVTLIEYLAWSEYKLGNIENAVKHTKNILKLHPAHETARVNIELFEEELTQVNNNPKLRKIFVRKRPHWESKYDLLCQGLEKMEQKILDKLYCKFHRPKPRFVLKPLKVEYAYNDPEIVIYHDLLRDHEIDHIKKKAHPLLGRATVHHPITNELVYADYRVSKSAWIAPEMDEVAANIILKVGDVTNLNMRYSEELQIQNYGLAGQYEPHFDHSTNANPKPFKKYGGNRIATVLLYMSDVYWGGNTVFTNTGPGVSIKPEKGAAVFWYNLLRNGRSNNKTQHAGCPVVVGQKWVSNLWIHTHGQEFVRPCGLNKDE